MAVYREVPTCPFCGKIIAEAITSNSKKIGDNFIRWEYNNHNCKQMRKHQKELSKKPEIIAARKALKKFVDDHIFPTEEDTYLK